MRFTRFLTFTLAFTCILTFGCVTRSVYKTRDVETKLDQAMLQSENEVQALQNDYQEKETLLTRLEKVRLNRESNTLAPTLRQRLKEMKDYLGQMQQIKRSMAETRGTIAAQAYNKKKVSSRDKTYEGFDNAVQSFEEDTRELNTRMALYAQANKGFSDLITTHKLLQQTDVEELRNRVRQSALGAQDNIKEIQAALDNAQSRLKTLDHVNKGKWSTALVEIHQSAQKYSAKAQRLARINQEANLIQAPTGRVTNLDNNWENVQKLEKDYANLQSDMDQHGQYLKRELANLKQEIR